MSAPGEIQGAGLRANQGNDGMAFRQGVADDQPSGSARSPKTRTFMFDLDLHWCERRGSRRHGLLGRREDVACGRRTRYVLRTLDSKVHPSCINGLKHFFGRSGMAVCNENLSSGVVVVKSAKDGVWSKHRVLRLEPQLRLDRRGTD